MIETEPVRMSFDDYFLAVAKAVSLRADCRRARHGALIVKTRRIRAAGYNGSAPGGPSCLKGQCPRGLLDGLDPGHDYTNCIAQHAEQNAIASADHRHTEHGTIYITGEPCDMCRKLIRAAGIVRIVYWTQTGVTEE